MDEYFKHEYLNQYNFDEEFNLFVRAWIAYHTASNKIDGHLPPGHPDQSKLGHLAVKAGLLERSKYVPEEVVRTMIKEPDVRDKWNKANEEALRRLKWFRL